MRSGIAFLMIAAIVSSPWVRAAQTDGVKIPTLLTCDGDAYVYAAGFASGGQMVKATRVLRIDLAAKTVVADTYFGSRTAHDASVDEEFVAFRLVHGFSYMGVQVISESGSLNRLTGEYVSLYQLSTDRDGNGYTAFSGKCKKSAPVL